MRDTSLAGSQVVISFSIRTISAVAASKSPPTWAASTEGVVNAAYARWVPIAWFSPVTFSGVNGVGLEVRVGVGVEVAVEAEVAETAALAGPGV
jgi:hypothetical protein